MISYVLARKLRAKQGFRVVEGEDVDLMIEPPFAAFTLETFRLEKLFAPVSLDDALCALEEICRENIIRLDRIDVRQQDLNEPSRAIVSLKHGKTAARKAILFVAADHGFVSFILLPD
jgi:hypothetical protein